MIEGACGTHADPPHPGGRGGCVGSLSAERSPRLGARAAAVFAHDSPTVTVGLPDTNQTPDLVVKYGDTIFDLQMDMDATDQYAKSAINSSSWDFAT